MTTIKEVNIKQKEMDELCIIWLESEQKVHTVESELNNIKNFLELLRIEAHNNAKKYIDSRIKYLRLKWEYRNSKSTKGAKNV